MAEDSASTSPAAEENSPNEITPVTESKPVVPPADAPPPSEPSTPPPPTVQESVSVTPEAELPQALPAAAPAPPEPPSDPGSVSPVDRQSAGARMRARVQEKKRVRLEKIVALAAQKRVITNDDVEKLLKVSDATATNYLSELVKTSRLKRSGTRFHERYEPLGG